MKKNGECVIAKGMIRRWLAVTLSVMLAFCTVPLSAYGTEHLDLADRRLVSVPLSVYGTETDITGETDLADEGLGEEDLQEETDQVERNETDEEIEETVAEDAEETVAGDDEGRKAEGVEEKESDGFNEQTITENAGEESERQEDPAADLEDASESEEDQDPEHFESDSEEDQDPEHFESEAEEEDGSQGQTAYESDFAGEDDSEDDSEDEVRTIIPEIVLSQSAFVYNGEIQKPTVTVKDGDDEINEDNYDLYIDDSADAGTYVVIVDMKGRYVGSNTASYTIVSKEIEPTIRLSKTSVTYNGKERRPTVTVMDGTDQLDPSEYEVSYESGVTDVGTYTVTVDLKGNYSGSGTEEYTIVPKEITPVVTLSKTSVVYNGKVRKPTVTVMDGTNQLEASDYTVTYPSGLTNVGTYKIAVKLKGNYSGSKTVGFKITAKAITPTVTLSKTSYTYNGKVQKPGVTVKSGSTKFAASNYAVTYSSGRKNVGIYKVTVKMKGNYSGSKTVSFKILPKGTTLSSVSAGKNQLTVKWKKQAAMVTGYQIQYSAKSDFSKAATVTVSNADTISRTITKLTKGATYYVRIRTYKTVGGTKLYSSWSSKKSKKITSGTVAKYSKTPVISLTGSNFKNTISWNKLSGAAGYEVSYKKGAKGAWTVLKRTSTLKITHSVTHGVYYYYRVRAYQDKPDGSRIYGNYSEEESLIQYYSPSYRAIMTGKTYTSTSVVVMAVVNYGDCNMTLYARNARLFDHDYSSFNRNLQLVNEDLEPISSVKIAPGDTEIICFLVRGSATWVDKKTSIYYEFKYDGMDYYAFSSYYAGTYYYKNN